MTDHAEILEVLRDIPLFSGLSDEELRTIIDSPANGVVDVPARTDVVRADEVGECMYVILDGTVDVRITSVNGQEFTIATLKSGEYFGEQALLPGSSGRRNATVGTLRDSRLLRIGKEDVLSGIRSDPVYSSDVVDYDNAAPEDRIRLLMRGVRLFRSLREEDLATIEEWTETAEYAQGDRIVGRSETGDHLYVILAGEVQVYVHDDEHGDVLLSRLGKGHYFGEQALLPQSTGRRNASVRAASDVTLVKVAREYFRLVLNRDHRLELALRRVGETQRRKIARALGDQDPD